MTSTSQVLDAETRMAAWVSDSGMSPGSEMRRLACSGMEDWSIQEDYRTIADSEFGKRLGASGPITIEQWQCGLILSSAGQALDMARRRCCNLT